MRRAGDVARLRSRKSRERSMSRSASAVNESGGLGVLFVIRRLDDSFEKRVQRGIRLLVGLIVRGTEHDAAAGLIRFGHCQISPIVGLDPGTDIIIGSAL